METSLSPALLAMLACPVSGRPLRLAAPEELTAWTSPEPFEGALVTDDGERAYPLRDGFPVLVPGAALAKRGLVGG
jgi:uncharacterized protein YbaR (Trm112 family)